MAEVQQVTNLPWQPQCKIRGNQAIGNLHHALLQWLKNDRGVHVETLLAAAGALTGFAAQNAALNDGANATARTGAVARNSIVLVGTKSGEQFLFGDGINRHLFEGELTLLSFATAHAVQSGVPQQELSSIQDIAGHVAGSLGSVSFGRIRVGREHQPHMKPVDLLKRLWPGLVKVMQLPPPGSVKEPDLDPIHWPIIAGIVAAAFIAGAKSTLDPRIGFAIVMEAAVIASKFDPATIDPGKWRLETRNGSLLVFRANA